MKMVAAKFMPPHLTNLQKEQRVKTCRLTKDQLQVNTSLFSIIITGDERDYSCCKTLWAEKNAYAA